MAPAASLVRSYAAQLALNARRLLVHPKGSSGRHEARRGYQRALPTLGHYGHLLPLALEGLPPPFLTDARPGSHY